MLKGLVGGAAAMWLLAGSAVFAGEQEDSLIDKVIGAYGGEALTALKTLTITDAYKSFRRGQSRVVGEVDQVTYQARTTIDYEGRRKSLQLYGGVYVPGLYVQHAFVGGETGYSIQHPARTVRENNRASFERVDQGHSWRSDIALAKLLSENRVNAAYVGEAVHKGRPQALLRLSAEGYPVFTLYIDTVTGRISKMTRPDGDTKRTYVFSAYREQEGFTFAADTYVMKGGKPYSLTATRALVFNTDIDAAYQVPEGYSAPAPEHFSMDMRVNTLADGVYHVGMAGAYSLFIDAGEYLIASGGYAGLADRYRAVVAQIGAEKPLKYQIVTHHHEDHIAGLKDAAQLGAIFLLASAHEPAVRAVLPADLPAGRLQGIEQAHTLAGGLVEVMDFASWHADHNLMTYVPAAKALFVADHFFTFQVEGAPAPAEMYAQFKAAIDSRGLDVAHFTAAHSGRVLTYADLQQAATGPFKPLACPIGWDFCGG